MFIPICFTLEKHTTNQISDFRYADGPRNELRRTFD